MVEVSIVAKAASHAACMALAPDLLQALHTTIGIGFQFSTVVVLGECAKPGKGNPAEAGGVDHRKHMGTTTSCASGAAAVVYASFMPQVCTTVIHALF